MRIRDISLNEFNEIANQSDVLRYINPTINRIDLAQVYEAPGVLVKGCDGVRGAVLIIPYPDFAMDIHWFMPSEAGVRAIRAIVDWVFDNTDAEHLFGNCPEENLAARITNRWLGGKEIGRLDDEFGRPSITYAISRNEWAARRKKSLA